MNYRNEKFLLDVFDDLNKLEEVRDIGNGKDLGKNQLERKIRLFLADKRLELLKAEQGITSVEKLKEMYCDKYCISHDKIDKLVEKKRNKLRLDGKSLDEIDEEIRVYKNTLNEKLDEQKRTLGVWVDNLLLNTHYPVWFKYWAFHKIITIDENFKRRRNDSYAPFFRFNDEIVSKIYRMAENHVNGNETNFLIAEGMFAELYKKFLLEFEEKKTVSVNFDNGKWIKYNKGSKEDAKRLCDSLQGKKTGWCTTDYGFAEAQVCGGRNYRGGDFYVYYTLDENNEYTNPRIAIRMELNRIGEIRGIGIEQNLEPGLEEIVRDKINVFNIDDKDKERYLVACDDNRRLTEIMSKFKMKEKLLMEDLNFIFEMDRKIEGFGWQQDERIEKIRNNIVIKDKDYLLNILKRNGLFLKSASFDLQNDREVVLAAISQNGLAFQYASDNLRNDKEVVCDAINHDGCAIQYADYKFRNDKEIVLCAIKQNGDAFRYVSDNLRNDREFILEIIEKNERVLQYVDDKFKNDKTFVLSAVNKNGSALGYFNDDFKNNKEIVLAAVSQNGDVFRYASDNFKNDKEIVFAAVSQNCYALAYASDELKNDKEVVLAAVSKNGYALKYASDELKNDKEVMLIAVKEDGAALQYVSEELKKDKEVVLTAVKEDGLALQYASDELKKDKEVVLTALKYSGVVLQYANEELKKDREFILSALKEDVYILQYIDESLKSDKKFMAEIVRKYPEAIYYISEELEQDEEFMKLVQKKDKITIKYISEKIINIGKVALQKLGIPLKISTSSLDNEQENNRMRI